jgi:hypothetical protein
VGEAKYGCARATITALTGTIKSSCDCSGCLSISLTTIRTSWSLGETAAPSQPPSAAPAPANGTANQTVQAVVRIDAHRLRPDRLVLGAIGGQRKQVQRVRAARSA